MPHLYEIATYIDKYEMYELRETATRSSVTICPQRGGIVTAFVSRGESLLYLDKTTLHDEKTNIRGGIPVLFPICGQLADHQYTWEGETYRMTNHGVARDLPWRVIAEQTDGRAALTLALSSNDDTRQSFPFDFELVFTYVLQDGALHIEQQYHNRSDRPMPMYAGFHPYFATADKNIAYATSASRYLDIHDHGEKPLQGALDMTSTTEAYILLDADSPVIRFETEPGLNVTLDYSQQFVYVVLWSTPGKPYICVEPWMALPNALNTGRDLQHVPAGAVLQATLTISAERRL